MAHFQEKLFDAYDAAEEDYETHLATYVEELSAKRYDTALESCDGMLEASRRRTPRPLYAEHWSTRCAAMTTRRMMIIVRCG